MNLPEQRRRERLSAAIVPTLWLMAGCSLAFMVTAYASNPGWWSSVLNGHSPNDYMVANQGQLKLFTSKAVSEMNATLTGSGGSGAALSNLVYGWQEDYATNGYGGTNLKPSDYAAVNVGQLKHVGSLVWGQLIAAGYTEYPPAWLGNSNASDLEAANLGQLKTVFNFDPAIAPLAVTGLTATPMPDEIDLNWTDPANNPVTALLVQEEISGAWTTIATLDASATSYAVTGLTSGTAYNLQVLASNSLASSSPTTASSIEPVPFNPTELTGTLDSTGNMNLTWSGSTGAAGYKISRETIATGTWATLTTVGNVTTYQDAAASYGTGGYRYEISASSDGAHYSPPSNVFPLPQYAIIDLGTTSSVGTPAHINNLGSVLTNPLSTGTPGIFWKAGVTNAIPLYTTSGLNNSDVVVGTVSITTNPPASPTGHGQIAVYSQAATWSPTGGTQTLDSATNAMLALYPQEYFDETLLQHITYLDFFDGGSAISDSGAIVGTATINAVYDNNDPSGYWVPVAESGWDGSLLWNSSGAPSILSNFGNYTYNPWDILGAFASPPVSTLPSSPALYPSVVNNNGWVLMRTDSQSYPDGVGALYFNPSYAPVLAKPGSPQTIPLDDVADMNEAGLIVGDDASPAFPLFPGPGVLCDGSGSTPTVVQTLGPEPALKINNATPYAQILDMSGWLWNMNPTTSTYQPTNLFDLMPDGPAWTFSGFSGGFTSMNDYGAIVGTATYTPTGTTDPIAAGSHGVMLVPFSLKNLADPYQGSTVIGTPSHNDQDTTISLSSTAGSTDINNVAWIAAGDAGTSNNPRMPKLQATVAAPGGTMVWWKLSVIFHGQNNPANNYRDFDPGATLTGPQITQLTNTSETGTIGYSDNIAVPMPSGSADSGVVGGWVPIAAGTPWNIYSDPDWTAAVGRGFFGGDAILSFKITSSDGTTTILPEQDFYFRIAGENPVAATCESYINTTYDGPTPNWTGLSYTAGSTPPTVPGYWFAYAMAKEETDGDGGRTYYNNFMDNGGQLSSKSHAWAGHEGRPDWNNDGSSATGTGGYGLFQLTYDSSDPTFIMPRDWIWNWQTNVKELLPIVKQKLGYTQGYLNYIHTNNASFTDPSALTTNADTTSFNFWESSVITLNNAASFTVGTTGHKRAGAWRFTPASGGTPASWAYVPNGTPGYLYNVARKGVENHP